jgi:hypothetical protein
VQKNKGKESVDYVEPETREKIGKFEKRRRRKRGDGNNHPMDVT